MRLVGLTGGIGSGKSTVAARLAVLGASVVDADLVAREVVEPGEPALSEVAAYFGDHILDDAGALDRPALAAIVFADAAARAELERITHPRIAERIRAEVAKLEAAGAPVVVVDHPLLVETGQAENFDEVVVVVAPEERRIRWLVASRGLEEGDARARLRAQTSDDERRAVATHVIANDGSLADLEQRVDELWAQLAG